VVKRSADGSRQVFVHDADGRLVAAPDCYRHSSGRSLQQLPAAPAVKQGSLTSSMPLQHQVLAFHATAEQRDANLPSWQQVIRQPMQQPANDFSTSSRTSAQLLQREHKQQQDWQQQQDEDDVTTGICTASGRRSTTGGARCFVNVNIAATTQSIDCCAGNRPSTCGPLSLGKLFNQQHWQPAALLPKQEQQQQQ